MNYISSLFEKLKWSSGDWILFHLKETDVCLINICRWTWSSHCQTGYWWSLLEALHFIIDQLYQHYIVISFYRIGSVMPHTFEIISYEKVKPVLDERLTLTSPSFSIELFLWLLVDDRKASLRSSPPLLITVLVIVEPKFEWWVIDRYHRRIKCETVSIIPYKFYLEKMVLSLSWWECHQLTMIYVL